MYFPSSSKPDVGSSLITSSRSSWIVNRDVARDGASEVGVGGGGGGLVQFDQPGRAFRYQWDQMLATYRFLQAGLHRLMPELMSEVPLE